MKGRNDHLVGDDEQGKLFVGGLSWETTQESLQRYFSRYGEVIDCVVMKNSESGRSRGFGFVTFADPSIVGMVLQNGPHQLDGRTIDPKACNPRTMQKKKVGSYPKVFLGGLPSNVTETDLRSFFNRYGIVMEVVIMYDQEKKKSRGFGFLSFEDEDAVDRCVADHFVNLNGKQVEIKRAEPRDNKPGGDLPNWGGPNAMNIGSMGMNMGANGPMANLGSIGPMQGYQGWNSTPPTGYSYGAPSTPSGYQGWSGPAGPQSPPQWGSSYGTTPPQSGYGSSYGAQTTQQAGYASTWNWNIPQNGPSGGTHHTAAPPLQSDMYSRGGIGASSGGQTPSGSVAQKTDYQSYGGYQSYQQDTSPYGGGRNYGGESGPQGFGMTGGYTKPIDLKEWPSS